MNMKVRGADIPPHSGRKWLYLNGFTGSFVRTIGSVPEFVEQEQPRAMYQPALRPDQIRALYFLKELRGLPMTTLVREAVDNYFAAVGGPASLIPDPGHDRDSGDRRGGRRS